MAAVKHMEKIPDGRSVRRGYHPDATGEAGHGALPPRLEEPLIGETALQLLEPRLQNPLPLWLNQPYHQLILSARLVDADLAEELHLQAVAEDDPLSGGGSGEKDARELRCLILEREVGVARGLFPEVGDLPLDPDRPDSLLQ
jgi:hypothetical protein